MKKSHFLEANIKAITQKEIPATTPRMVKTITIAIARLLISVDARMNL